MSLLGSLAGGLLGGKLFGGGHSSPTSTVASDTYAALTRQQWANYVQNFVPIENQLIKYATDTAAPEQAMAKASEGVNQSFAAQEAAAQRQLQGLGVELNADERAAQARDYGLSKSLADVNAQNIAGQTTRSRQQSLLGNPAPTGA
jgi:hypothetical protein